MFNAIRSRLDALLEQIIPQNRLTIIDSRREEQALARSLNVDRVHQILQSAEQGDVTDLMSLYRDMVLADNHLQGEFTKRKLAVLGDVPALLPENKKVPADVATAAAIESLVKNHDDAMLAWAHLLDATLYPVAVVEKVFQPSRKPGIRWEIKELIPVPHHLLDFSEGRLRIWDLDENGIRKGTKHDPDPARYIVHRGHLLTYPDNWGGPMRSLVFWFLLSAMDRDWWARFLERFGSPFLVGKYDQADDASRSKLQMAFSAATRLFGVVVSKDTQIELQQAAANTSGDAFEKFHSICQREKSKLILGQTLSAEAQSTGLGSGVSNSQEKVRSDFRDFDAMMLAATLRRDLFKQLIQINHLPGACPTIIWGSMATGEIDSTSKLLTSLAQAGLQVGDEGLDILSERTGLPIERMAASPALNPLLSFSAGIPTRIQRADRAIDDIAREGAATLALAFRGSLAPIRRIILNSATPEECEQQIRAFYADWSPARVAPLIEEALIAYAANGAAAAGR